MVIRMLTSKKVSYKRGIWMMESPISETTEQESFHNGKIRNFFSKHQYIMGVATSLTATAIMSIISSWSIIHSIPDRFTTMEQNVNTLTTDLPKLSQDFNTFKQETFQNFEKASSDLNSFKEETSSSFTDINNSLSNLEESTEEDINELKEEFDTDINNINEKLFNIALNVVPTSGTANSITQTANSMRTENFTLSISLDNSEIIAIDNITREEYTAPQLAEQKLFIPYINEKGQEVFFLGQFNKNNQWDGECIINIYENDNLILVTEGEYKDGHILNYKQVLPFTTNAGLKVWSVSERSIVAKDANETAIDYTNVDTYYINGESWNYFADDKNSYRKHFNFDDASEINIVTVDQFKSTISSPLEGYYFGNTSNGKYNDDTGTSYMIKYFENGTVRTLYHGDFKNGSFNDSSNEAWYISKSENTTYMYYKGKFENEKPLHNENSKFENYLTLERIRELLIENGFFLKLNWDEANSP